jgi:hypothetical protein
VEQRAQILVVGESSRDDQTSSNKEFVTALVWACSRERGAERKPRMGRETHLFLAHEELRGLVLGNVTPESPVRNSRRIGIRELCKHYHAQCSEWRGKQTEEEEAYLMEMVLVVLSIKLESNVKGPNHSSTLLNHSIVTASSRAAQT